MNATTVSKTHLIRAGSVIGILVVWQVLIGVLQVIPAYLVPPPTDVLDALVTLLQTNDFLEHIRITATRVFWASLIASIPGIIIGLAMGWSRTIKALIFPIVGATYPLPKIALLPLLMLVLGVGEGAFIGTAALASTFLVMFNSMRGVSEIGDLYFDVAKDNGVDSPYTYFTEILLPGALPMIFTGLRLTLNTTLLIVISIEFIAARQGLGAFIWTRWSTLQTAQMYAAILVVSVGGIFITYGLAWFADHAIPWKPAAGGVSAE
ncbi:ABC transporter permease [Halobellus salinisoli]|uniref:ABC transporter permease n=1 Tax=Halobellus salinisoli TaxID=3108500 RepID=UPI0030089B67